MAGRTAPGRGFGPGAAALALLALLAAPGLAGCATGADDTPGASQRADRMKADCERRGGAWYPRERSCVGADPLPR
jgi:hypothetical protein